ncbi:MAG: sulfotransferase domain-containing protein [Hyphomonas sp.]
MKDRIDFLIAGVQKGGTTALDAYLRQHPEICMAKKKEPHFFDRRPPTGIGAIDRAIYHRNFDWSAARDGCRLGEATPITCWWQGALERVWDYNSEIRLIMLLRDPVERAWSHYRMDCRRGRETLSFAEAIRMERERARRSLPHQDRERSYLSRSFYAPQVREMRRLFPDSQLLFLRSEGLSVHPQVALAEVCDFLGVARHEFDFRHRPNAAPEARGIPSHERAFLSRLFRHDAAETCELLGWRREGWSV